MSAPPPPAAPSGVGVPLPRAFKMHQSSLTDQQVRSLTSLYCLFADKKQVVPFVRALCACTLRSTNPDPIFVDGLLICLRDIAGESTRDSIIDEAIDDELDSTLDLHTLMRTGSIATRLMTALYRTEGADWLTATISPLFQELSALDHSLEFETKKLPPGTPPEKVAEVAKEFQGITLRFLINLYDSACDLPAPILRAVIRASKAAEKKFPAEGDKRGGGLVVGDGMLMLRYISPAVMNPLQFDAKVPDLTVPHQLNAALTLSKVIQVIANGVNIRGPDAAMAPIAAFVESQFKPCIDFILSIINSEIPVAKPPPDLTTPPQQIPLSLFNALVAVQKEVENHYEKMCADTSDQTLAQAIKDIAKPPKAKPQIFSSLRKGILNVTSGGSSSASPAPSTPSSLSSSTSLSSPTSSHPPPAAAESSGSSTADIPHDLQHVTQTPAYSGLDLSDPTVGECHLKFDDILADFRRSVLAAAGANFARIVDDHKKLQDELKKEREARIYAEKNAEKLQEEIKKLQDEIAKLKEGNGSGPVLKQAPRPLPGGPGAGPAERKSLPKPTGPAADRPGSPTEAIGEKRLIAMPEPKNLSCMPAVPFIRQSVGLLDDILKCIPEKLNVPLTLYLVRVASELQKMQKAPLEDDFNFTLTAKYTAAAYTPQDTSVTMETEKIKAVVKRLPELLMGFRNWYQEQLSDGKYLPREYAKVMLRAQDTVQLLLNAVAATKGE